MAYCTREITIRSPDKVVIPGLRDYELLPKSKESKSQSSSKQKFSSKSESSSKQKFYSKSKSSFNPKSSSKSLSFSNFKDFQTLNTYIPCVRPVREVFVDSGDGRFRNLLNEGLMTECSRFWAACLSK